MLNIIVALKGGCRNEHNIGMSKMKKLGMTTMKYNGAPHESINTLNSRNMQQPSGMSGHEVFKGREERGLQL